MSDSFPPDEGPDPYEGQDLEGLLSGMDDSYPAGLRPVAQTLDALRAAPMRAELGGEAAARADFRRIMLGAGSEPARPADGSGDERTLILPTAVGTGLHPVSGRHRRRPSRRGHWQAKTLAGVAVAAVVAVGATALAGTFHGSGSPSAQSSLSPSALKASTYGATSKGVEGGASQEPGRPSPTTPTQSADGTGDRPSDLCREFYDHSLSESDWNKLYQRLSKLASPMNVKPYCQQFFQVYDSRSANQGNQGFHERYGPPLHGGNGYQNSGQGKDGSGFDGQSQNQQ